MQGFVERDLPRLLDLLYDAALDPAHWQAFLDAMPPCFGRANGVLYDFDKARRLTEFNVGFGIDPAFAASYDAYYSRLNPYMLPALSLPVGRVVPATAALDADSVHRSEFYNDWMRPQGVPADHLGALLELEGNRGVVLGLAPHASVYDRNRETYQRRLGHLLPHIRRALKINRLTAVGQRAQRTVGTALDTISAAALLIDRASRIVLANRCGEELLRGGQLLSLDRCGAIRVARPQEDAALKAVLAAAAQPHGRALRAIRLTTCSERTFIAWVLPTIAPQRSTEARGTLLVEAFALSATALLLVVATDVRPSVPADVITAALGLSAAEARLASALCAGQTLDQYAATAELSRNTVRNQLAAVFSKTGTARQTALVAMIMAALAPIIGCVDGN